MIDLVDRFFASTPHHFLSAETCMYTVAEEDRFLCDFLREDARILILFEETRPLRAGFFKTRMGPISKLGPNHTQSQALRPGFTGSACSDHAFKFAPLIERILSEMILDGKTKIEEVRESFLTLNQFPTA